MICPACNSEISRKYAFLGRLGSLLHYRCTACGMTFNRKVPAAKMKKILGILFVLAALILPATADAGILPPHEEVILKDVARQYRLSDYETKLLMAIRRIENGRAGLEMGVGDGIKNHPARRYAGNHNASLRLQAEWAAGTIKRRYNGDMTKFAQRYCKANWRVWLKNTNYYVSKQYLYEPESPQFVVKTKPVRVQKALDEDADTVNKRG